MAILTFKQDYTSAIILDSELMGVPTSGDYWNVGTSPLVTINNILAYLPKTEITISEYDEDKVYSKGELCLSESAMYESLADNNDGHSPSEYPLFWLATLS